VNFEVQFLYRQVRGQWTAWGLGMSKFQIISQRMKYELSK